MAERKGASRRWWTRYTEDSISERPLWLIALMLALHAAWIAFCSLWIPSTFGLAITERFGSPVFILPAVVFTYAVAPFVASFSELGREYWDLVGRGGSARRAGVKVLLFGVLCVLLAIGSRQIIPEPRRSSTRATNSADVKHGGSAESHSSR